MPLGRKILQEKMSYQSTDFLSVTQDAPSGGPTPSSKSHPECLQPEVATAPTETLDMVDDRVHEPNISGSKWKTTVVIICVTCITGMGSFLTGLIVVTIPTIAAQLRLGADMALWPVSIYALTCGCTLLLCGTISDVVGSRQMYLLGCFLQAIFTLACGLSKTSTQLILFRAFSGVAASFCLPSAVSIINNAFPPGRSRNMAFASMGGGQPVGFGTGLVLGGVFADSIGWEWGFYIAAILNLVIFGFSIFHLPRPEKAGLFSWHRMLSEIDWVGALIASSCLSMLSFVLASLTGSSASIKSPATIATLSITIILIPAFILWIKRQEGLNRPALIPNSLWRNRIFTSICINVFLIWGALNAFEQMVNFFFQNVQKLSPLQASLRFFPAPISGAITNLVIGFLVSHIQADRIVIVTAVLAGIAPLLMAVAPPGWTYWALAFPAVFLNPLGGDGLFTISNLLITSAFPAQTQGLAGGVFNTISQIGKSVGLALVALIANRVTLTSGQRDDESPEALLEGYRASFWFLFGLCSISLLISVWGLRKIGKVGKKEE